MPNNFRTNLILALVLILLLAGGIYLTARDMVESHLTNLDQIAVNLSHRYVDEIDPEKLKTAGIQGMLSILDPYSELLEAKTYSYLLEETAGEFQGLGIEIIVKDKFLTVVSTLEGTPANRAGLMAGDRIIKINGENVFGISSDEAVRRIRGEKGTKVQLTVTRPGNPVPIEFTVARDVIEVKAVPYYGIVADKLGYIRLKKFSEHASSEVSSAINELKSQGMQGLILDLRGNPGGLLTQAVEVAGLFLNGKKLIMETKGQDANLNQKFYSDRKAILPDLPLAILIDGGSASASEIVAGAIQDWDRGVVIGDTSFGKGMVQSLLELEDGLALKLTTAKYFTPSGRCLQRNNGEEVSEFASAPAESLKVPESSDDAEVFTTQSGRKVEGSGGIVPDILIPGKNLTPLLYQLSGQGLFFDFAVDYIAKNPGLGHDFEVSDQVYNQFVIFAKNKGFQYRSASEQELEILRQIAAEEFNSPVLGQKLAVLDWFLKQEEKNLFVRLQAELKWKIKEAVVVNLFGEKARYERVWFGTHPEILKAQEVLRDKKLYSSLLSG